MDREGMRSDLAADVKVMRELGVVEWNGIKLSPTKLTPDDIKEMTAEDRARTAKEARDDYERLMFASSGG